jgi:phosphoribosylaminoimidazolecarboxamide formyltransferase/IMP cyclohydrolase
MRKIQRALISVSDKTGLLELAQALVSHKIEIISSGGTAKFLSDNKIPVIEVSEFTQAPEMLDGRLKTLHPKIHGGILAKRNAKHLKELKEQNYPTIDLVVVNLYPFEETLAKTTDYDTLIENIDIGGPTMLRSAAKNHESVTVLVEPLQYAALIAELSKHKGETTLEFRKKCSQIVFEKTATYDASIASYFQSLSSDLPSTVTLGLKEKLHLRYGENPHQRASFVLPTKALGQSLIDRVLQGKQLSYNNLMDVHAAIELINDLNCQKDNSNKTVAIFKHTNPCGVARSGNSLCDAYVSALACDPVSAFGGIIAFSHEVDEKTALQACEIFTEIMIAPSFSAKAITILEKKKNLRLLEVDYVEAKKKVHGGLEVRKSLDGYLIQEKDSSIEDLHKAKVVTKRQPTKEEFAAMDLAWRVCKHVKSNAIVISNQHQTVGIGAGQMSRVDASKIAMDKIMVKTMKTLALASDAFFPFRDGIDEAVKSGITCVVQPGGSIRDSEVIQAADEHNLAMIFTGVRHFKH